MKMQNGYNAKFVALTLAGFGLPRPEFELQFCAGRKWRFDLAWPAQQVALEVQGGIWSRGRHTRGAALLQEWDKLNTAAQLGWRVLFCQPGDLLTLKTVRAIKAALRLTDSDQAASSFAAPRLLAAASEIEWCVGKLKHHREHWALTKNMNVLPSDGQCKMMIEALERASDLLTLKTARAIKAALEWKAK